MTKHQVKDIDALRASIAACTLCADRFGTTKTRHAPRPVVWFNTAPRILIAGQAPGLRVHEAGKPFWDRSGDRLRDWLGIDKPTFYDQARVSIVPMAFCFPGYSATGSDLPPPKICAQTWRSDVMDAMGDVPLTLVIGGHAQTWHLGAGPMTPRVAAWRDYPPRVFPLPHPSWRNNAWLKANPWLEAELVPALQARVKEVL